MTSTDPDGFKGGINWYAYVWNRPTAYRDPLGLKPRKPYDVLAANGRDPLSNPNLCHPTPCLQGCLENLFGQTLRIYITPHSKNPLALAGFAVSGYGTIDLPDSCEDFLDDPEWVLHEYYHVVYQWQPGPGLFGLTYVWQGAKNPITWFRPSAHPAEAAASSFASGSLPMLKNCMKSCTKCQK